MIRTIHKKLFREILRLKGQIATIALVLASGITCFIGLRGTYESLLLSRDAYYDRYRFADVFAHAESAPESAAAEIAALPGVASVDTRILKQVTLPMEGLDRAAYAQVLSLPAHGEPASNALHLVRGRLPNAEREEEVVVLDAFANAHGLEPGARIPAVIHGKERKLRVVGTALSPEFVYALRPGALADDPKRNAVLWMGRRALAAAFRLEGAFDDVAVRVAPGASVGDIVAGIDRVLAPYGGNGAIARKDQVSNRILTGELSQLQSLAGMVPLVFLGVAAFLINVVLARLVTLQRGEIAILKAVGYSNRDVAFHYLGLVGVVMVPGAALGVLGGWGLGTMVLGLYEGIFRFPSLVFHLSAGLAGSAIGVSTIAAATGALLAVRSAANLPPAEAMRPPAPARYRRGIVERLGLRALLGTTGLMVGRELGRRPLRLVLSSLGIGGAVALVVLGHFGIDSLDSYLEGTLRREQRHDLAITFAAPVSPRAVSELSRMHGVLAAEGLHTVPVRVRFDHRVRDSALVGVPAESSLRRLVAHGGREIPIPPDGVLVTAELGKIFGLRIGDRIETELREGTRETVRPVVVGFADEAIGLQLYARSEVVSSLQNNLGAVSSAVLVVDPREKAAVERHLRRSPQILDVSDFTDDIERLHDMNAEAMDIWTAVSVTLASLVIFGVVYNNARISLEMRSRDLASLRVIGFSRAEISMILIAGLAIEVLLAIPIGLVVGRLWANVFFSNANDHETFRFDVAIAPKTYGLAVLVAVLAAIASAAWVRRNLDRLDLVAVLKTRE